jgi:hypothetical protein
MVETSVEKAGLKKKGSSKKNKGLALRVAGAQRRRKIRGIIDASICCLDC